MVTWVTRDGRVTVDTTSADCASSITGFFTLGAGNRALVHDRHEARPGHFAPRLRDKVGYVFGPPGWRPELAARHVPTDTSPV